MFFLCLWVMFVSLLCIIRAFVLLIDLDRLQINIGRITNECIDLVPFWRRLIWACAASWRLVTAALIVWCIVLLFLFVLASSLVSLSNENADARDVMNSNQRLDVSLDGTILSHTTNLNAFVLTPAVRICRGSVQWKRENINFRLPVLTSGTSTFSLLKVSPQTNVVSRTSR